MGQEMNLLLEAREIVRTQPRTLTVAHLRSCADQLDAAYAELKHSCTRSAATQFTAAVNRVVLAIERVHACTPPTPAGGRMGAPQARQEKAVTSSL